MKKYIQKWKETAEEGEYLLNILPASEDFEKKNINEVSEDFFREHKILKNHICDMDNGEFYICDKEDYSFAIVPEKPYSSDSEFRAVTSYIAKIGEENEFCFSEDLAGANEELNIQEICNALQATVQLIYDTHKGFIENEGKDDY
jgi:hypothetical protein